MSISRRSALGLLAATLRPATASQLTGLDIQPGPFQGTRESLKEYQIPEWFRDAKFGIWAHWGPQSAPEQGDWYARNLYLQGSKQYQDHLARYGHPTRFGYKDIIPTWKCEQF